MSIIGIDYSITSPSICVKTEDSYHFLGFAKKANVYTFDNLKVTIEEYPSMWKNSIDRYTQISNFVIPFIKSYTPSMIGIEGYSYGSKGLIFNLAENCATLKYRLHIDDIPFVDNISPASWKKSVFGKGNGHANKEFIYQKFVESTGIDIKDKMVKGSPYQDIADSFFICNYVLSIVNL